jgi:hypothetical protein
MSIRFLLPAVFRIQNILELIWILSLTSGPYGSGSGLFPFFSMSGGIVLHTVLIHATNQIRYGAIQVFDRI